MSKPKQEFIIRYKSGAEVHVRAESLSIKLNAAKGLVEAQWEDMQPRPMWLNVDAVESVWQVR